MNGGSTSTRPRIGTPRATASAANTAPDETPRAYAWPPTAVTTAARSSISRSTAYGNTSPLSPRPRRSYVTAVNPAARGFASGTNVRRALSAPPTRTTAGPSPYTSIAIGVPSSDLTVVTGARPPRGVTPGDPSW